MGAPNAEPRSAMLIGFERDRGLGSLLARSGVPGDYRQALLEAVTDHVHEEHPGYRILRMELLACPRFDTFYSADQVLLPNLRVLVDLSVSVRSDETESVLDVAVALQWSDLDGTPRRSAAVTRRGVGRPGPEA